MLSNEKQGPSANQNPLNSSVGISSQPTAIPHGDNTVSANPSTGVIYKTNTLDQYGARSTGLKNLVMGSSVVGGVAGKRNHQTNQSANMMVRGMNAVNLMNYSILQSELDQESCSLEDMHMFFVAFNHR